MQQLNQWVVREDKIILTPPIPADIDSFEAWTAQFSSSTLWQILSVEKGADRAQLHFRFEQCEFLLHYEALCEALWIEPMNNRSADKIRNLIRELD